MLVKVKKKTGGDNSFEKFAAAFEQADGPIRFRKGVVGLIGFGDGDDLRSCPRVDAAIETFVVEVDKAVRIGCKCPFEQLVVDSAKAGSGGVGRSRQGVLNLV